MSTHGHDDLHDRKLSAVVDGALAYVLLIFLGTTGAHRMYLGRWWSGIFYFFTLGFLGLGIVYDLFMIPSMALKKNGLEGGQ